MAREAAEILRVIRSIWDGINVEEFTELAGLTAIVAACPEVHCSSGLLSTLYIQVFRRLLKLSTRHSGLKGSNLGVAQRQLYRVHSLSLLASP